MPGSLRVLLVDNDADSREPLRQLVGLWGHQVQIAPDGLTAVDLARSLHPEAALVGLDLLSPDAVEVCRRLREMLGTGGLVVGLAACGEGGVNGAVKIVLDRCLVKPVDPAVLKRLLDSQAALRRWQAGDDG
jgi:DNA-binding response OmpR family regulator